MEGMREVEKLGSGNFGSVYLVQAEDNKLYALKKIDLSGLKGKTRDKQYHEALLLQQLDHKNIVKYKKCTPLDQELHILMEYCSEGDLAGIIDEQDEIFPEEILRVWFHQLASALEYIHKERVLHRDIKPQNIFVHKGNLKLGDFGLAKMLGPRATSTHTANVGTLEYMAPEVTDDKHHDGKADVWSLGLTFLAIATLRYPPSSFLDDEFEKLSPEYSSSLKQLLTDMLHHKPSERPSPTDILNHPFIADGQEFGASGQAETDASQTTDQARIPYQFIQKKLSVQMKDDTGRKIEIATTGHEDIAKQLFASVREMQHTLTETPSETQASLQQMLTEIQLTLTMSFSGYQEMTDSIVEGIQRKLNDCLSEHPQIPDQFVRGLNGMQQILTGFQSEHQDATEQILRGLRTFAGGQSGDQNVDVAGQLITGLHRVFSGLFKE